ncbi:hypothetical protein pb186bvf_003144 [Paramecium bursaria]
MIIISILFFIKFKLIISLIIKNIQAFLNQIQLNKIQTINQKQNQ